MKSNKLINISLILFILLSFGCKKKQTNDLNDSSLSSKDIPVIVEKTLNRNLKEYIQIIGTLEGKSDISFISETSGKIVELNKKLGDWVNKGETIGRIDNKDFAIQLNQAMFALSAAEATKETADLNLKSAEVLKKAGSISYVEYSNAKSSFKNAFSAYEGALARVEQARKTLDNSNLTAPISGQIVDLPIQIGQTINMGSKVCGIVDTKNLIIKTGVGESSISQINNGQPVVIDYSDKNISVTGVITGIGLKPLTGTANYPIEIALKETKGLLPGMVVKGEILSKTYTDVLYVSLNSIVQEYDKNYVFVIDDKSIAHRLEVKLGKKINENVIILEGLKINESLVTEGYENLEEGVKVTVRN